MATQPETRLINAGMPDSGMAASLDIEAVAMRAFGFAVGDGAQRDRFLAFSGAGEKEIEHPPIPSGLLVAALDFLLANEPALLRFARVADVAPERVYEARRGFRRPAASDMSALPRPGRIIAPRPIRSSTLGRNAAG